MKRLSQATQELRDRVEGFFRQTEYDPADWGSGDDGCSQPYVAPVEGAREALDAYVAACNAETEDTERLNWLDTLPSGMSIPGDAAFGQAMGMTPKQHGFSHTRHLIDTARKHRETLPVFKDIQFKNNDHEADGS